MALYSIIDIETTGGRITDDRITEIAIYIHNGEKIIDSFHSLVNPERYLPIFITELTGITNEMLANAPKFYEIAKQIVEITEGKIFVAHNAHFDYSFVKNEFKNLGFNFQRKTLCTVRLSRKIFPNLPSYSLGKLCNSLSIPLENRHRAEGDAKATCILFERLIGKSETQLNKQIVENEIQVKNLPPKISRETFDKLPEETGVYYFLNEKNEIIYVGKSKSIKKRIASHFATNLNNRKTIELKNQVAEIDYIETGSELIALLLESDEIKKHKPLFNTAQRRSRFHFGIFHRINKQGYIELYWDAIKRQRTIPLVLCQSAENARSLLYHKIQDFQLCMKLCGLYKTKSACFDYSLKKCLGACIEEESPEDYNARAEQAIASFNSYAGKSFVIISKGRNLQEKSIVCVENGQYLGFGYIDESAQISNLTDAKDYIKYYEDNRDIQKILHLWLKQNPKTAFTFETNLME